MTTTTTDIKKARQATRMFFLLCGLSVSAWAPMVPFAKDRLQLNDSSLGLLLLFLGVGAICTMPLTGWFIKRAGSRSVMMVSSIIIALALPSLSVLNSWAEMAATLFVFGAGIGALDVSMNAHGNIIQNLSGRHIMSSLHGLFSVGGLLGPLVIGGLMKVGLTPFSGAVVLSVVLLIIAFSFQSSLLNKTEEAEHTQIADDAGEAITARNPAWLNGTVLFLGMMCFIAFLSEGAMLDWGALLLHDSKGLDKELSGMGYAFFSVAMAVMRLSGDGIVSKFNSKAVVLVGSIIAFAGYGIILLSPWIAVTLLGFVLIGIGCANIVPVFFSAAGNIKNVAGSSAVSIMGTIGYAGQLAGPAVLGFLAQLFSLPLALFVTGLAMLVVGVSFRLSQVAAQK